MKTIYRVMLVMAVALGTVVTACAPQPAAAPTPVAGGNVAPSAPTPQAAPKLQRVKFQTPSRATIMMPFFLGKEKGVFQGEGLDLEIILIQSGLSVPALLAGEVDFIEPVSTAMVTSLMGTPIKAILSINRGGIWTVFGGPDINTAADLKGKTVGTTSPATMGGYATKKAMAYLGLDPDKDLIYVNLGADMRLPALKAKSVAAAVLTPPYDIMAANEGFKKLVSTGDILDLPADGLVTTDRKIKENPDQVKRMLRGTLKSLAYARDNPKEAIAFMVKDFGFDEKVAKDSYEGSMKITNFEGTITSKGIDGVIEMARAGGQIKGNVDAPKSVDLTLLKEVQKELGLAR